MPDVVTDARQKLAECEMAPPTPMHVEMNRPAAMARQPRSVATARSAPLLTSREELLASLSMTQRGGLSQTVCIERFGARALETELGFPRDEDPANVEGIERRGPDAHQLADCLMQQVDLPEERWEVDLECEEPATSKGRRRGRVRSGVPSPSSATGQI